MKAPSIVWFRQDLRVIDQPALNAAIDKGGPIIPLFIWAPKEEKEWTPGAASRWWLHGALARLQKELNTLGIDLILRQGSSFEVLADIIKETGADAVFWNRRYEPNAMKQEAWIKAQLHDLGIKVNILNGSLLFEPWEILTQQSKPYRVFTPFWKRCCQLKLQPCLSKPKRARSYENSIHSASLQDLDLLPKINWDKEMQEKWQPESYSCQIHFENVLERIIQHYSQTRDVLATSGTSELSPSLHFGEISPRMIWHRVRQEFEHHADAKAFLRQLGWREFAYYLLYHFPYTQKKPLYAKFEGFQWQTDFQSLQAWQQGKTGYPIVDAGMRQLWQIGWMHNRARMIVGSFLVKDLLIDWQEGARWFWDTLVDADLANNTLGWQWIAGCGADAAPYFRVFNPVTQGEKFDAEGDYVRRWIPELAALPNKWIHCPWKAPEEVLRKAKITLGKTYPYPIIDHEQARKRALSVYAKIKEYDAESL